MNGTVTRVLIAETQEKSGQSLYCISKGELSGGNKFATVATLNGSHLGRLMRGRIMSDYDPIEIRMEQMEGYYRRFMNQSPRDAYDSEYGMHLLHAAAIMTLADAIEYLANSHHDYVSQLFNIVKKKETDV